MAPSTCSEECTFYVKVIQKYKRTDKTFTGVENETINIYLSQKPSDLLRMAIALKPLRREFRLFLDHALSTISHSIQKHWRLSLFKVKQTHNNKPNKPAYSQLASDEEKATEMYTKLIVYVL
ncbi:hypothetical protein HELRODRAFT_166335 [Helobdella robusta]|uniref:Uncharacterized protein n=1 Tax=Helobdella robusta TaxID=6412 RepID=T1EY12_HELRO|nr:hypothetical protein HELRODRAFT_166335 [Helobdella robusta]ESN90635.1 hypothetical protein HELRODRAFT_166335 [Helobdella robusta]